MAVGVRPLGSAFAHVHTAVDIATLRKSCSAATWWAHPRPVLLLVRSGLV